MKHVCSSLALIAFLASAPVLAQDTSIVEANVKLLEAGDTVAVSRIPDGIYLRSINDPDDVIWERLPEYRVLVAPAPAVHESVELRVNYDDEGYNVYLSLAATSERFYVRMRWRDDTMDDVTRFERFRDSAAVQFSLGDDETSYIMGTGPDEPVNIWYWRADTGDVQSLGAGGPGSTTMLDDQPVTGNAIYSENAGDPNEWTVVMSRPLKAEGDYQVSLQRKQIPLAFAVWQGSDGQRDGLKSVTDGWILMDMDTQ